MKEYFLDIWAGVSSTATGMAITFSHLFTKNETQQYLSEEKPETRWNSVIVPEGLLQERSRMRLHVKMEDCIGCKQCEKACPVDCITITTEKREKTDLPIFAANGQGIKQNTVQSTMDRLFRKGLLDREKVSHAFVYRPAVSREELSTQVLGDVLETLAGGETGVMLSAFVNIAEREGDDALAQLEELIAKKRGSPTNEGEA